MYKEKVFLSLRKQDVTLKVSIETSFLKYQNIVVLLMEIIFEALL